MSRTVESEERWGTVDSSPSAHSGTVSNWSPAKLKQKKEGYS